MRSRKCFEGDDVLFVVIEEKTGWPQFFGVCAAEDIPQIILDVQQRQLKSTTGYRVCREPVAFVNRFKPGDIVYVPPRGSSLKAKQFGEEEF